MSAKVMTNSDRKRRGGIYLAIAAVCIFISAILPQANALGTKEAVIVVSLINVIVSLCLLIFFVGGVYYLITGFIKKA